MLSLLALRHRGDGAKDTDQSKPESGRSQSSANPGKRGSVDCERGTKSRQLGAFTGQSGLCVNHWCSDRRICVLGLAQLRRGSHIRHLFGLSGACNLIGLPINGPVKFDQLALPRMLIALPAIPVSVTTEIVDCRSMSILALRVKGSVSVGLNAKLVVKATNT